MFNIFNKKSKFVLPPFETLAKYSNKDKYFYRIEEWFWLDDKHITIIDSHSPRLITLDPWPQLVFLDAKGKLTVTEYVEYMATQYKSKVPEKLDDTIIYEIDQLLKEKLIALSDTKQELHPDHDNPKDLKKKSGA
jgi:hypothetical protein